MRNMRKWFIMFSVLSLFFLVGCELETTDNGDLDGYWHLVKVHVHENFGEVLEKYKGHNFHYCSTKAPKAHSEAHYEADDLLVLGKETAGIPEEILQEHWDECVRIPMVDEARSLNLGNSAAIVAYEALRQLDYPGLSETGPGLHI